jgi:hypothetical protein
MAIEKAGYTVFLKENQFEIRIYEPMVIAISDETDLRGYSGFNEAFNYISGNNEDRSKISMTTPVLNDLDGKLTTAFVMPKEYKLEDLPKPTSRNLSLRQIDQRKCAALSFSGNTNADTVQKKIAELRQWIQTKGLTPIGSFQLARYNPPFIPGFLKKNEVLIEIQDSEI